MNLIISIQHTARLPKGGMHSMCRLPLRELLFLERGCTIIEELLFMITIWGWGRLSNLVSCIILRKHLAGWIFTRYFWWNFYLNVLKVPRWLQKSTQIIFSSSINLLVLHLISKSNRALRIETIHKRINGNANWSQAKLGISSTWLLFTSADIHKRSWL